MRLLVFALALIIHEFAHGFTAYFLGDDGFDKIRRIKLIFIPFDALGSFIGPLLFYFADLPIIGWAHSPHIHTERYINPKNDPPKMILAGIIINIILGCITFILLKFIHFTTLLKAFFIFFLESNLLLALINIIPLLPFDAGNLWQYQSKTWRGILS
ncbi:MAG: hypothetical protein AB1765_09935, partial [Candidatus Hydrogenedentota bacterium]